MTSETALNTTASGASSGKGRLIGGWIAVVVAAGILAFSGFIKIAMYNVAGGPHVFAEKLGVSPSAWMALGAVEMFTALLLLIPKTSPFGGILGAVLMVGALGAHATKLGFDLSSDTGSMWPLAALVLVASATTVILRRDRLPHPGERA